jgi:hypothetical protein
VFVSIYMKEDAELVLQSRAFGELSYLTPGEIDQTSAILRGQFASNGPGAIAWRAPAFAALRVGARI